MIEALGYVASTLVFAAFFMKAMTPLRMLALCSNITFFAYGFALGLTPVWLLHAVLLPVNVWRLAGQLNAIRKDGCPRRRWSHEPPAGRQSRSGAGSRCRTSSPSGNAAGRSRRCRSCAPGDAARDVLQQEPGV